MRLVPSLYIKNKEYIQKENIFSKEGKDDSFTPPSDDDDDDDDDDDTRL
jgi:hypothetical protein